MKSLTYVQAIAELVTEKDLAEGRLYPPLNNIREVSIKLAVKVSSTSQAIYGFFVLVVFF